MKAKNYIVILIVILSGLFIAQCKKYPEDDVFIQWKKPEKRLIKCGPWVFDKLTVDGVDKSAEFRADSAYFDKIEFHEHEDYATDLRIDRDNTYTNERGLYKLLNNNESIEIRAFSEWVTDIVNYGPIFTQLPIEWEILRLSKKGMTLKTVYNSSEYILYLTPES